MASPLLASKLQRPPRRADLVARPRLVQTLDRGLRLPLTLVSAPPGFGKTSLVSTWLEQRTLPTAWYSLDQHDNDLVRFLTYLVAALETVHVGVGRRALAELRARRKLALESVMTPLSNDIAAIPRDFVVVFDDYHRIELTAIHEAVTFLLDHAEPRMHLIIATQADPPLPLARMRARGQLSEVRVADLRFSIEEAAEFLNDRMGLNLTRQEVAALETRAEGWIAGLQLAALSMRGNQDVAGFIEAFTGNNQFVLDYLIEEVLQRQPQDIQTFLLQTSLLEQMNASLADAITGRNNSAQVLSQLEKANLFVIPLDDTRQWYRYHHLFADVLQSRVQQSKPEQVAEVHRRASTWYEQSGFPLEAVGHALAVPDFNLAADLIEELGKGLLMQSEDAIVLDWLARLPDDTVRQRPSLYILHATAFGGTGQTELAAARLAQADQVQLEPHARKWAGVVRAGVAFLGGDLVKALAYASTAVDAVTCYPAERTAVVAQPDPPITLGSVAMLAELQLAAGQLRRAASNCRHGLEIAHSLPSDASKAMYASALYLGLAEMDYEWNELREAAQHAAGAIESSRAAQNREQEAAALAVLATVKQALGDRVGALDAMQQAEQLVHARNVAAELGAIAARKVNLLVAQNLIGEAAQVVSELPPESPSTFRLERIFTFHCHISVSRARLLIAQREFARALQWLERLQVQALAAAETGTLVQALALLAIARQELGEVAQATAALARALSLAENDTYIRTFVDLDEPMRSLISAYAQESLEGTLGVQRSVEYLNTLLAAFPVAGKGFSAPTVGTQIPRWDMVEVLSERELIVLQLIAEGLSNKAIAERLVLTVSTVKTHIYNIFGKLSVRSRTQALARARELQWL